MPRVCSCELYHKALTQSREHVSNKGQFFIFSFIGKFKNIFQYLNND